MLKPQLPRLKWQKGLCNKQLLVQGPRLQREISENRLTPINASLTRRQHNAGGETFYFSTTRLEPDSLILHQLKVTEMAKSTQSDKLIQCYGLRWKASDVFWGKRNNPGTLLGYRRGKKRRPVDFREQLGVYVLYAGDRIIYVGEAHSPRDGLYGRLRKHREEFIDRWDRFSWFGFRGINEDDSLSTAVGSFKASMQTAIEQVEAVLIATIEPGINSQGGKFQGAEECIQIRDENLGKTHEEMVEYIFHQTAADGD